MNAFLRTDVLAQADPRNQAKPSVAPDANLTVRTALDRAARQVGGKFPGSVWARHAKRGRVNSTPPVPPSTRSLDILPETTALVPKCLTIPILTIANADIVEGWQSRNDWMKRR